MSVDERTRLCNRKQKNKIPGNFRSLIIVPFSQCNSNDGDDDKSAASDKRFHSSSNLLGLGLALKLRQISAGFFSDKKR